MNIKSAKRRIKAFDGDLPARTVGILLLDRDARIPKELEEVKNIVVLIDEIIDDKVVEA